MHFTLTRFSDCPKSNSQIRKIMLHVYQEYYLPVYNKVFFFFFLSFFFCCPVQHVGSYFPYQGSNLCPLHWKRGLLTTGPPGKSLKQGFNHLDFYNYSNKISVIPSHIRIINNYLW